MGVLPVCIVNDFIGGTAAFAASQAMGVWQFFSIYFDVISDWQCAYWHMLFAFFVYFFFL